MAKKYLTKRDENALIEKQRDVSLTVIKKQTENRIKQQNFLHALKNLALWNISEACQVAGITRKTFNQWIKNDAAFAEAYEELEEAKTDWVEAKVFEQANQNTMAGVTASLFLLKCRGKKRGYVEKQEIDINNKLSGGVIISPAPVTETEWCNVAKEQQKKITDKKVNE